MNLLYTKCTYCYYVIIVFNVLIVLNVLNIRIVLNFLIVNNVLIVLNVHNVLNVLNVPNVLIVLNVLWPDEVFVVLYSSLVNSTHSSRYNTTPGHWESVKKKFLVTFLKNNYLFVFIWVLLNCDHLIILLKTAIFPSITHSLFYHYVTVHTIKYWCYHNFLLFNKGNHCYNYNCYQK